MRALLQLLMLLLAVLPFAVGCSSRMSEEAAERLEAEQAEEESSEIPDNAAGDEE